MKQYIVTHKYDRDPSVFDDSADGFDMYQQWINTTTGERFECKANTVGAAVWEVTSLPQNQLDALNNAINPSGTNPFATADDLSNLPTPSNDFDDIIPDPTKGKKLAKVKDDGTGLDYTDYGYDEVVQKAQTFNEGTLKKFDVNGNDVDSGLTGESLDIYAISPSLINALTNESNWRDGAGNQITGEVAFASGIKGQRYYSNEFFYECIADNNWVRTYTGRPVINIYDNPTLTLVFKGYLEDTSNWVGKIYVGTAITGVAQGTRHYDNDYVYEFFQTNVPIRYSRD